MLGTFSKNKRMHVSKPPIPNSLCTGLDIAEGWPWREFIKEPIDEDWLNKF
jgi:hypothetical protein